MCLAAFCRGRRGCGWRFGGAGVCGGGVQQRSRNGGRRPDLLGIEPIRLPGSPNLPSAEPPRSSGPDKAPSGRWMRGYPTGRAQPSPRPPQRRLDGAYPCCCRPPQGRRPWQRAWCSAARASPAGVGVVCERFHKTAVAGATRVLRAVCEESRLGERRRVGFEE